MGICSKCRTVCSSVSLTICDGLLCDTCEATRISTIAMERSKKSRLRQCCLHPLPSMGTQKSSSTRWSLKSQWHRAICSSRYPKPEEETVSSPIEKTSPCPQKTHTCIEDCSFPSGRGGKRIRCCVSSRHYHVKCLNLLEDEIEGHAWPCLECRVLPYNVKYIRDSNYRLTHFMSSMMNDKITEIKDLKLKCQNFQPENETLRQHNTDLQYETKINRSLLNIKDPKRLLGVG